MITVTFGELMNILLKAQDLVVPTIAGHSKRVAIFSRMLGEVMGYTPQQLSHLEDAAKLHDIGCFALSMREKKNCRNLICSHRRNTVQSAICC